MYFIPRNNKVYSFLITVPRHMWYLMTVVVIALLSVSWWAAWYMPSKAQLMRMQSEYEELLQQSSKVNAMSKEIDQLNHSIKNVLLNIKGNVRDYDLARIDIRHILNFIEQAGLKLYQYTPRQSTRKDGFIIKQIELNLVGSFRNIEEFLRLIAKHEYPIHVDKIDLSKRKNALSFVCEISIVEALDEVQQNS